MDNSAMLIPCIAGGFKPASEVGHPHLTDTNPDVLLEWTPESTPPTNEPPKQHKPRRKDLTDQKFGKWIVEGFAGLDSGRRALWHVRCECGEESTVTGSDLTTGHSTQCRICSAVGVISHGHTMGNSVSSLYSTWRSMKARCLNPRHKSYQYYGGRGITVWPQWQASFEAFAMYVSNTLGPKRAGQSLDRVDNNKGYAPGNLRWATQSEQRRNQRKPDSKQNPTAQERRAA